MPIHGKALCLILASSGMRIGETLQLKLDDVDLNQDPIRINIRGEYTKTGNPRITFASSEAKETIDEWLKVRDQYLKSAVGKSKQRPQYKKEFKGKSLEDDRLFPFTSVTAYRVWRNAMGKSGILERDKSTNRYTVHPHVLRKFFRTKMGGVIQVDIVEALMGHEGYLTEVYRRYSEEDLAKFYKQGEASVLIFTEASEVAKLRIEVEERNKQLQTLVNGLATENMMFKESIRELDGKNVKLEQRFDRLDAFIKKWLKDRMSEGEVEEMEAERS